MTLSKCMPHTCQGGKVRGNSAVVGAVAISVHAPRRAGAAGNNRWPSSLRHGSR